MAQSPMVWLSKARCCPRLPMEAGGPSCRTRFRRETLATVMGRSKNRCPHSGAATLVGGRAGCVFRPGARYGTTSQPQPHWSKNPWVFPSQMKVMAAHASGSLETYVRFGSL